MTVAGNGGRPGKWRSDADRVRAFRARQRGESEPVPVDAVADENDALAAAWRQVDELGRQLEEQRTVERELRTELRQLRRELDDGRAQFGWLQGANDALRADLAASEARRGDLEEQLVAVRRAHDELRLQLDALRRPAPAAPPPPASQPGRTGNRAQRRLAAREAKRRRG